MHTHARQLWLIAAACRLRQVLKLELSLFVSVRVRRRRVLLDGRRTDEVPGSRPAHRVLSAQRQWLTLSTH